MLVINEWIFHDLRGENKADAQQEAGRFLIAFEQSDDTIAVLYGSQWMEKIHELMEQTGSQINNPYAQRFGRILIRLIRTADKCIYRTQSDIAAADIPKDAIDAAPKEDRYLIKLYYAAKADLLITTDHELHDAFESHQDVNVTFRDDFLTNYIQQN